MISLADASDQLDSFVGDLTHRIDVSIHSGRFDSDFLNRFVTSEVRADWLKKHRPDLVPPPQNGTEPSVHRLGQIFERTYFRSALFRTYYISTSDFRFPLVILSDG